MKLSYMLLMSMLIGTLYAADDRRLQLESLPAGMFHATIVANRKTARNELIPKPSGTMADIYTDIKRLGLQGFIDANPDVEREVLVLQDRFDKHLYDVEELHEIRMAGQAFQIASSNPLIIGAWENEFTLFFRALMMLGKQINVDGKFTLHPCISQLILLNHGVTATKEERTKLAAHIMLAPARMSQRFVAMERDEKTFRTFLGRVPGMLAEIAAQQQ